MRGCVSKTSKNCSSWKIACPIYTYSYQCYRLMAYTLLQRSNNVFDDIFWLILLFHKFYVLGLKEFISNAGDTVVEIMVGNRWKPIGKWKRPTRFKSDFPIKPAHLHFFPEYETMPCYMRYIYVLYLMSMIKLVCSPAKRANPNK